MKLSVTILFSIFAILTFAIPTEKSKSDIADTSEANINQTVGNTLDANGVLKVPIAAHIENRCKSPIYVFQTVKAQCDPKNPNTPMYELRPGSSRWMDKVSRADNCGVSMEIARTKGSTAVYQVEYVIDARSTIWWNLSHVNGNPFTDVARWISVYGTGHRCKPLYYAPGDNGNNCDWMPAHPGRENHIMNCPEPEDVYFRLC